MQSHYCLPDMNKSPYEEIGVMPEVGGTMDTMMCDLEYPEVYYKVQPFVMAVCDKMGRYTVPTQNELLEISDTIYDNVCHMYPDIEEYAGEHENHMKESVETLQRDWDRDWDRDWNRRRQRGSFRRRGLFRDFIDILLLNEIFRRGGFFWY